MIWKLQKLQLFRLVKYVFAYLLDLTNFFSFKASLHPMSIIIVGVGNADFSEMRALDSDGKLLTSGNKTAARDIVQFVSFNECIARGSAILAQQVLAEVPGQLLQFMERNNFKPNPKKV